MFLRSFDFKTKLRGGNFLEGGEYPRRYPKKIPRKFAPGRARFLRNCPPRGGGEFPVTPA